MYSPNFRSKHLVLSHILAIQFIFIRSVSSLNLTNSYLTHKCGIGAENYKSRSEYEKNLNYEIRRHMSSHGFRVGYGEGASNTPPNSVAILFWCRADSYGSKCRSCYDTAIAGLRRRCKRDIVGNIWYDQCFLGFSGKMELNQPGDKNPLSFHNPKDISGNIVAFNTKLVDLLNKLMSESSCLQKNNEPINYAVGEMKLGTNKVYAMVQCMQVMNIEFCKKCLESNIKEILTCCKGKQGAIVLSRRCNVRYELYPFLSTHKIAV